MIMASDLAELYGVATKALNQAVKRNAAKFPSDFMFHFTAKEAESLRRPRSQLVTLKRCQNIKCVDKLNKGKERGKVRIVLE